MDLPDDNNNKGRKHGSKFVKIISISNLKRNRLRIAKLLFDVGKVNQFESENGLIFAKGLKVI